MTNNNIYGEPYDSFFATYGCDLEEDDPYRNVIPFAFKNVQHLKSFVMYNTDIPRKQLMETYPQNKDKVKEFNEIWVAMGKSPLRDYQDFVEAMNKEQLSDHQLVYLCFQLEESSLLINLFNFLDAHGFNN